ncbi:uncharacterized mitochondrial protein AtMg00810-like [Rutidosis leptorrhynchoides]|uniref:uncharacterized mitochondrial protein AtMg00810-like n=1 Tax=Rutidosis leptorrhynchoides TaxID=125765 RepID=UPI003A999264
MVVSMFLVFERTRISNCKETGNTTASVVGNSDKWWVWSARNRNKKISAAVALGGFNGGGLWFESGEGGEMVKIKVEAHGGEDQGGVRVYKVRLIANGCSQQVGIDCDETFYPLVKPGTIRTVLSIAASRHWPVHQLDVKNVFLHGHLSETVYMHQPPGFHDPSSPDHGMLSVFDFSIADDTSLFIYRHVTNTAYLLLYVDDILRTASSPTFLQQIISSLHKEFSMTDLGPLNYFLGYFGYTYCFWDVSLSQKKYAFEIIERADMGSCHPCKTPIDAKAKFTSSGPPVKDPISYRSLSGALQYLTFTRPDITYAVQHICLFMHDPREPHLAALRWIIRYIQGTINLGLQLYASSTSSLVAYSDADWAGCPSTRRSTSGYCVFLGNNMLSWLSKRQSSPSRSSAEAEFRGVANAVVKT